MIIYEQNLIKSLFIPLDFPLASNKLAGDLPSELTSLTSLQNLGLSDNKLKKYYFSEEICNNTKLEKLDLSQNELAGEIPFFSSACKELITLKLSKNFFSGMLGRDINKLTNLRKCMISKIFSMKSNIKIHSFFH